MDWDRDNDQPDHCRILYGQTFIANTHPAKRGRVQLEKISQGDLDARAFCASSRLGEINHLVTDFNEMAEKLQTLDIQRKSWNAAIAHELRTPVTILRGRLQGLVDGVFTPDPVLFTNLLKQTEGLTRLIEDLRYQFGWRGSDTRYTGPERSGKGQYRCARYLHARVQP
jgi:signal transduction histidine kinase